MQDSHNRLSFFPNVCRQLLKIDCYQMLPLGLGILGTPEAIVSRNFPSSCSMDNMCSYCNILLTCCGAVISRCFFYILFCPCPSKQVFYVLLLCHDTNSRVQQKHCSQAARQPVKMLIQSYIVTTLGTRQNSRDVQYLSQDASHNIR